MSRRSYFPIFPFVAIANMMRLLEALQEVQHFANKDQLSTLEARELSRALDYILPLQSAPHKQREQ